MLGQSQPTNLLKRWGDLSKRMGGICLGRTTGGRLRLPIVADCASVRRFRGPVGREPTQKDIPMIPLPCSHAMVSSALAARRRVTLVATGAAILIAASALAYAQAPA